MSGNIERLRPEFPYDRRAVRDILERTLHADERRSLLYGSIRDYDRALERRNIERLAPGLRERGELLIFGRMSRAFHNQGMLFADAVRVLPRPDWPAPSEALDLQGSEAELALAALCLLLNSPGAVPLIQWEGALERFEDGVLAAQHQALSAALRPLRARMENHADGLSHGVELAAPDLAPVFSRTERYLGWARRLRASVLQAEHRPACYVVIGQRPSPTGSHLLAKMNEGEDPYPGKPENLTKLTHLAGDRVYGSPDYGWLEVADHWIEAIPLFIKEETHIEQGRECTQSAVDIAALEAAFREQMADRWAVNLRAVLDSEFLALARATLAAGGPDCDEDTARCRLLAVGADPHEIAALALLYRAAYRRHVMEIQLRVELEEQNAFEAARTILPISGELEEARRLHAVTGSWRTAAAAVLRDFYDGSGFEAELQRLLPEALRPRRPLPALHVLTTQSAGMTDAYIRNWLEESMALYNVVEDLDLVHLVAARRRFHSERLRALSEKLIRELGLWVEVEEMSASEDIPSGQAVIRLLGRHPVLEREVSCLGTLLELREPISRRVPAAQVDDPPEVRMILASEADSLLEAAMARVLERNGRALRQAGEDLRQQQPTMDAKSAPHGIVADDEILRRDLDAFMTIGARRRLLDRLDAQYSERQVQDLCRNFLRRYRDLAKTTARKEVLAERGLQHLASHPWYRFSATGGGKRYHLVYSPSRVDLGPRERESVETWSQWVGGADRAAMREGRRLYELINKDVRTFESLEEPEVLKTGENASMASHYAFSNALALMVAATGRGDCEDMADQMNRRLDRRVHPAGEGYGGYCVPKDGLFLEFVLSLRRGDKLSQIGLPAALHPFAAQLAAELLHRRGEFSSELAWNEWGAARLQEAAMTASDSTGVSPVFQPARLAHALQGLGRPELRDPGRTASRLAARWGLHKMVTGGEQVNRFMPFFKTWLIRQALEPSRRRSACPAGAMAHGVVVLTAEYKPDTQDCRFSAGLRKFEILAGTGDHLLAALDPEGQDLAILLSRGFAEVKRTGRAARLLERLEVDAVEDAADELLQRLFPAAMPGVELRLVSPTGLSPLDLMGYTSDTGLSGLAEEVRSELASFGFGPKDIEANLRTHGPHLSRWDHRVPPDPDAWEAARQCIGGRIHALSLAVLGPERDYRRALLGADVLDTGIPHAALLDLLANPGALCRLMLTGNPRSALAIVDGASGARPRALNRLDVMLWFAAGERYGREAVYLSIGLGQETIEHWRSAMRRGRRRAERLLEALAAPSADRVRSLLAEIVAELRVEDAARTDLEEVARLARTGRVRDRDWQYARALTRVAGDAGIASMDFGGFLAIGGIFLLAGADRAEIADCRCRFEAGIARVAGAVPCSGRDWAAMLPPVEPLPFPDVPAEQRVEGSNKAFEERPAAALALRRQLESRLARARGLCERRRAYTDVRHSGDFAACYGAAMDALSSGDLPVAECDIGRFIGLARHALAALMKEHASGDERAAMLGRVDRLCTGRRIDPLLWQDIAGGYEDIGDFGRMAQQAAEQAGRGEIDPGRHRRRLERIAEAIELFEILLAVETVQSALIEAPEDPLALWRALADFFARTLNDHTYEYRPWLYSRGIGFADIRGEDLYSLAVNRHAWLYRYLRRAVTRYTELRELPTVEQDSLLGNFLDGAAVEGIGAEGDCDAERAWRAYGQIRELAFIRSDGFPLPEVFPAFDPDLIAERTRVNHVIAAPVGRTHFSRLLREGPTLAAELERQARAGANLLIGRKLHWQNLCGGTRPVAVLGSGHFYADADTYRAALARHKPGTAPAQVHAKGIRLAARFTRPVQAALVYPFHGDPAYVSGALEDAGLPATVQSLFHTWTTYDKAKYPAIFRQAGVDLPAEIDWFSDWNARGDSAAITRWIRDGLPGTDYPGLAAFASEHARLIVKDAAESGGRNMRVFQVQDAEGRPDPAAVDEAVAFVHLISMQHNVAVQELIPSSPENWATEEFMRDFVHRQIVECGQGIDRSRDPDRPLYGSLRVILSTDHPDEPDPSAKWHTSHWITLNSRHPITNIGRGGTLEQLLPEFILPTFRETLLKRLAEAARKAAEALAAYADEAAGTYQRETGRAVGRDLLGVSYSHPRYLMLDFLVAPVFGEYGGGVTLQPSYGDDGSRIGSVFVSRQGGKDTVVTPTDWRVVLIEPNIGVGLWDRVALREEVHELRRAGEARREPDWNRVGQNARIVLRDLHKAGEQYLYTLLHAAGRAWPARLRLDIG